MFTQITHRDDSHTRAQEVYGALRAALALLNTLNGYDEQQEATLKATVGCTVTAIVEIETFADQRRAMHK